MTRPLAKLAHSVEDLNARFGQASPQALLEALIGDIYGGKIALVSSFGAESAVLLHMVAEIDRATPVVFLDTLKLFPETLQYQRDLTARLGLTNLEIVRPDPIHEADFDPDLTLSKTNTTVCCFFRKVVPLRKGLRFYSAWITGRKSYQAETRARLPHFERDGQHVKVNPLAGWTQQDVADYMSAFELPPHPLVAQGFPSIGCIDCTTAVGPGEDPRAGRWRGEDRNECGIHIVDGQVVRGPVAA